MSRVVLSPRAQADLKDIGRHIAQRNVSASKKWIKRLRTTCRTTIGTFPECGTQCDDWLPGMRCFKGRNPVRILRIVHGAMEQDQLEFEP